MTLISRTVHRVAGWRSEVIGIDAAQSSIGFDTVPERPVPVTVILFLIVVTLSATTAAAFKESALWTIERLSGLRNPTTAAAHLGFVRTALIVATATVISACLARYAAHRWPGRQGLEAVAASARGETRSISLAGTSVRATATWLTVVGMLPIGRESAILETGGAIGSWVGRHTRGHGATLATAGIAASFATAYHAPIAAILYLEEHLRVRGSRRALTFTIAGAIGGHLLSVTLLGGKTLLPPVHAPVLQLLAAGAVAVVPAALSARLFLTVRERYGKARNDLPARLWWMRTLLAATATGLLVAWLPLSSGNGLDALRRTPLSLGLGVTLAFALAVSVAKLAGNTAAFAAGAPGGVLTPTMTIAAGATLLTIVGLHAIGVGPIYVWGAVALGAAAAIAVGLRSPFTAILLIPELTGSIRLIPATAAVVALAVLIDRGIDHAGLKRGRPLATVHDEDG